MSLPTPFDPSPDLTEQILHQLATADRSLGDIASFHSTTLPALVLWMAKPEIAEQISALESAFARHQRLAALNQFPAINRALAAIIHDFNRATGGLPTSAGTGCATRATDTNRATTFASFEAEVVPGDLGHTRPNTRDRAERLREADCVRRACALLMRLARFTPGPARHSTRDANNSSPAPSNSSPAPSGGGGPSPRGPEGEKTRPRFSRAAEAAALLEHHIASLANDHPDELINLLNDDDDQQDPDDDEPLTVPTTADSTASNNRSVPNSPSPLRALRDLRVQPSAPSAQAHLTHLLNTINLSSFPTRPGITPPTLYGPNGVLPPLSATHPP